MATITAVKTSDQYPIEVKFNDNTKASWTWHEFMDDIKNGVLVESGSRTVATVGISNSIFSAEKIAEESISCVEGPLFHRIDIGTPLLIEKRKKNMDSLR